jgi:hypothetical protein
MATHLWTWVSHSPSTRLLVSLARNSSSVKHKHELQAIATTSTSICVDSAAGKHFDKTIYVPDAIINNSLFSRFIYRGFQKIVNTKRPRLLGCCRVIKFLGATTCNQPITSRVEKIPAAGAHAESGKASLTLPTLQHLSCINTYNHRNRSLRYPERYPATTYSSVIVQSSRLLYLGLLDPHTVGWMGNVPQAIKSRALPHHRHHVIRHGNSLCSATLVLQEQKRIENESEVMLHDITIAEFATL